MNTMMQTTTIEIAARQERSMQSHDETKAYFTACIKENMQSLYALALRLTHNNADAEDLVAESITKAWSVIHTLEDRARFRPWLFRILHNRFISDYRKKAVRPNETSYDELADEDDKEQIANLLMHQPNEFLNWWANPEREFANNLLGDDLMAAIESLPETFRITVLLINIEGLSYDETAEVLNVSPGTVRSRMNRGRTLLQKALWQHAKDAGLITDRSMLEC
jgi:RNA polymerase sigma-70 factor (ECF subfamily)